MKQSRLPIILLLGALLYLPASTSTVTSKQPPLQPFCTTLTTPNTPIQGHPSNLTFTCPNDSAFNTRQPISSIPTFTLPAGYSALYLTGPTTIQLISGTPTSLQPGNYQYLAQYDGSALSTLSTFTITWSS